MPEKSKIPVLLQNEMGVVIEAPLPNNALIKMNGKSKSRFKSKTKETRTRLVLKERKRVIALRTEGHFW